MADVIISSKIYAEAKEPEKVLSLILGSEHFPEHKHLVFAKIKCLFKDKLEGNGWDKLGKVAKVNDLFWSLLDLDFILILNKSVWDRLGKDEKLTLILHLISKIKVLYKSEDIKKKTMVKPKDGVWNVDVTFSGRINFKLVSPDIEEFEGVAKRFSNGYKNLKEISMEVEE